MALSSVNIWLGAIEQCCTVVVFLFFRRGQMQWSGGGI